MKTFKSISMPLATMLLAGGGLAAQGHDGAHTAGSVGGEDVPLLEGLGTHAYAIDTDVPKAQAYFNQGLRLYYAFNHAEAIRSFREAQRLDPDCAMCWWGEALAWGPNINLPMDEASGRAAYRATKEAVERIDHAAPRQQALITALEQRYAADPPEPRGPLDDAYAAALADAAGLYPEDHEILVLHGEAVMTRRPWDYWDEAGNPREGISEVLAGFERVLAGDPNHPGACHFYIHAVEKLYPEKAVACADRLAAVMPAAGHLVHMPGHIYIRVGRYHDAIDTNRHAVHADESYINDVRPGTGVYTAGYYPHNYDFLAFAASMIGRREAAIDAARRIPEVIPAEMLQSPGMTFLQHYATRPYQLLVRFGRWEEILAIPAPNEELHHAVAMWYYAQGRALAATGKLVEARAKLARLKEAVRSEALQGVVIEPNQSTDVLGIAENVLAGRIAFHEGDLRTAISHLERAVRSRGRIALRRATRVDRARATRPRCRAARGRPGRGTPNACSGKTSPDSPRTVGPCSGCQRRRKHWAGRRRPPRLGAPSSGPGRVQTTRSAVPRTRDRGAGRRGPPHPSLSRSGSTDSAGTR